MASALASPLGSLSSNGRTKFWGSLLPTYSVEDVPEFDPECEISSPRSLEACEMEGILPAELLYTPFEEFAHKRLEPEVLQMRYEYHEAHRQDLLALIRHRRAQILLNEGAAATKLNSPSSDSVFPGSSPLMKSGRQQGPSPDPLRAKSPGLIPPGENNPMDKYTAPGSPPPSVPFPNTFKFFNYWNKELAASKEIKKKESTDSSPKKSSSGHSLHSNFVGVGSTSYNPSQNKMEAHEQGFLDQLQMMKTCHGSSRIEKDFARNTENNLVALRADDEKAREASQATDRHTLKWKNSMENATFDELWTSTLKNKADRDHRAELARSSTAPTNLTPLDQAKVVVLEEQRQRAEARQQIVFEKRAQLMKEQVERRTQYYQKQTGIQHARTEKLANEAVKRKMAFAQQTMHDRLRWRENHHHNVTLKLEQYEKDKKQMFEEREADLKRRLAISDNRGALRKELYRIRTVNRQKVEGQRARKSQYLKRTADEEHREWKDSVNARARSLMPEKMKSNLSSTFPLAPASQQRSAAESLAMSRPVPTHISSPLSAANRAGSTGRLYASWYRHG